MKNFFLIGIITLSLVPFVSARETMIPDAFVRVDSGKISSHSLLASPGGEIFIEFSSSTHFVHEEGLISFNGEILSPSIIDLPDQRPRLRMEPLISFELITDSGEPILFADRFDLQNARNRLREKYLNPETTTRSSWVKLIMPIEDETIITPQLWEYIGPDEGWASVGGILDQPTPEGIRVFSVILRRTGVYTVFDIDPIPKHFTDEFEISEEDPLSPVNEENTLFWDESDGELPDGLTWEEIQSLTENGEIKSQEEWDTINALPESQISVHDRAITTDDKVALEARKTQLISELSRTTDPKDITLLKEYLSFMERKILIADQREQLVARKEQLEAAVPKANTEKLQADLTDQLAMVDAQLKNLEDVEMERRIQEIESSLHLAVSKEIVPQPILEEPAPQIEIPVEAELPKSGANGDSEETPSLIFPLALLGVILFVIASGVIASRKKI